MRRYSEAPSTPTPLFRHSELSVGATVTLPSTGKTILRYVGPVKGKNGIFAGLELVEKPQMGKNSGDFQGDQYFTTKIPCSGLFMPLDKLRNSLPQSGKENRRLSAIPSPFISEDLKRSHSKGNPRLSVLNGTPSMRRSTLTSPVNGRAHNSTPPLTIKTSNRSSVKKMSPISVMSPSLQQKTDSEIQRITQSKIIIETERDNLLKETLELRHRLQETQNSLDKNNELLEELQKSYHETTKIVEEAHERARVSEDKLVNQRRVYETQRRELLEVIDQVEAQVNDNERLYVSEMKKLQDELSQKQEIIDDLQLKLKDLQTLYEKQKNSSQICGDEQLNKLRSEVENLKLTNLTQVKAIEHLRRDVSEKEEKLDLLNKNNLALKENYINDKGSLDSKLEEYVKLHESLKETIDERDKQLDKLRAELSNSPVNKTIEDDHKREVSTLTKKIKDLEKQLTIITVNDKVQELEFKLENKDNVIADLRSLIEELQNAPSDDAEGNSDDELERLKTELNEKDIKIDNLSSQLNKLEEDQTANEKLQLEVQEADKSKALEERILELEKQLSESKKTLEEKELLVKSTQVEHSQLDSAKEEIEVLKEKLGMNLIEKEQVVALEATTQRLENDLLSKDEQIRQLESQLTQLSSPVTTKSSENIALEEKILEVELLKEELAELKSTDHSVEVEKLRKELETWKQMNKQTTNKELSEQIQLLQKELLHRPTTEEVQELKSELELLDQLRLSDRKTKDKEIYQLKTQLKQSNPSTPVPESPLLRNINQRSGSSSSEGSSHNTNIGEKRPSIISQVIDGALQVYVPEKKDPANGRKQWCGLCERHGHDSIDCPFENDVF